MRSAGAGGAQKDSGVIGVPVALFTADTTTLLAGTQKSFAADTLQPVSRPNCGEFRSTMPASLRGSRIL